MFSNRLNWVKFLFIQLIFSTHGSAGESKKTPIILAGWPYDIQYQQVISQEYDPIVKTLLCPSLTRLNLQKMENESYLLRELRLKPKQWSLSLTKDLRWWDGSRVTSNDLEKYLFDVIPKLAEELDFIAPDFHVVIKADGGVDVLWKQEPDFGPYILNQAAFYKIASNTLEPICAGTWKPVATPTGLQLTPIDPDKTFSVQIEDKSASVKSNSGPYLRLRYGEELHPKGFKRQIDAQIPCDNKLDTVFISLLAWNLKGVYTSDSQFRNAMTMLLPRGAIMRAGAGGLGDLVSAPILRNHPGYNKTQLVTPYDPNKAESILKGLKFPRSEQDGFRRDSTGKPIELKIYVSDYDGSTLLRKVIDDSFRALGFRTIFTNEEKVSVDAYLTVVRPNWPDGGLHHILQNGSKSYGWQWSIVNPELKAVIGAYKKSLTSFKPDFRLLEKIHEIASHEEYFSVLMQHRICLDSQDRQGKKVPLDAINQRNPDWLLSILQRLDKAN